MCVCVFCHCLPHLSSLCKIRLATVQVSLQDGMLGFTSVFAVCLGLNRIYVCIYIYYICMSFRQRLFIQKRIMQNISSSIARSRTQLARLLLSSEWRRLRSLEWTVRNSGNKTISNCWKDLVCMVPVVIYATCTEHLYYDYDIIELFRIIIELYWHSCVYVFDTAVSKRTQFLYIHNNSNDNMIYTCPMYWTWIEGAGEREREIRTCILQHCYCNIVSYVIMYRSSYRLDHSNLFAVSIYLIW